MPIWVVNEFFHKLNQTWKITAQSRLIGTCNSLHVHMKLSKSHALIYAPLLQVFIDNRINVAGSCQYFIANWVQTQVDFSILARVIFLPLHYFSALELTAVDSPGFDRILKNIKSNSNTRWCPSIKGWLGEIRNLASQIRKLTTKVPALRCGPTRSNFLKLIQPAFFEMHVQE